MTDLKTLAEAATHGMWRSYETLVYLPKNAGGFDIRNSPNAKNNAAYIAAASPDAILKLLAERDRLREALEMLQKAMTEGHQEAYNNAIAACFEALEDAR